jgi:hypothetical protein
MPTWLGLPCVSLATRAAPTQQGSKPPAFRPASSQLPEIRMGHSLHHLGMTGLLQCWTLGRLRGSVSESQHKARTMSDLPCPRQLRTSVGSPAAY